MSCPIIKLSFSKKKIYIFIKLSSFSMVACKRPLLTGKALLVRWPTRGVRWVEVKLR